MITHPESAMSSTTLGLKELHHLQLQLADRQKKLTMGPRQVKAKNKIVGAKQQEFDARKASIVELQKQADDVNLQVRTNEQRIAETKTKLNQASSNKEFDIFRGQVANDEAKNEALEDQYLELLEQVDNGKVQQATLETELAGAEAEEKALEAKVAEENPGLIEQKENLEAEIKQAEKCIPSSMSDDYKRLVSAYGPDSIAAVEEGACTCCFEELIPQLRVEIRMGKIIRCRSCARLLYSDEQPVGKGV
jgi:predicted  nucleic acid-binding Zn-ribbon protein